MTYLYILYLDLIKKIKMESYKDILETLKINVNIEDIKNKTNEEDNKEVILFNIYEEDNYNKYNENYETFSHEKYDI